MRLVGPASADDCLESKGRAKKEVQKILEKRPDDATFEDIRYHIYVARRSNAVSRPRTRAISLIKMRPNGGLHGG